MINYDLIVSIIAHIHKTDKSNSILVFLPGYEEIVTCQDKIENFDQIDMNEFQIFILHSSLPMHSQRGVFSVIPRKQKIVLSTNIAETSITMSDVAYVIDAGLAKEKIYDSVKLIRGEVLRQLGCTGVGFFLVK